MTFRYLARAAICSVLCACGSAPPPPSRAVTFKLPSADEPGIVFRNDLDSNMKITDATFHLDAAEIQRIQGIESGLGPGAILIGAELPAPGDHELEVALRVLGAEAPLVGFKFDVKASHAFKVQEGKPLRLEAIVAAQKGRPPGPPFHPVMRFEESIKAL
jgi:hypothetical protein